METTAKYQSNVEVVSDPESLAQGALKIFIADAQKAIKLTSRLQTIDPEDEDALHQLAI